MLLFLRLDISYYIFFFSSRRRHTRSLRDWSSDVCSSDLALASGALAFFGDRYPEQNVRVVTIPDPGSPRGFYSKRSEERRVGKECRYWWWPNECKENITYWHCADHQCTTGTMLETSCREV